MKNEKISAEDYFASITNKGLKSKYYKVYCFILFSEDGSTITSNRYRYLAEDVTDAIIMCMNDVKNICPKIIGLRLEKEIDLTV